MVLRAPLGASFLASLLCFSPVTVLAMGPQEALALERRLAGAVNITVRSAGFDDGNFATFEVDGQQLAVTTFTGLNMVVLWPNASLKAFATFDTYSGAGSQALVDFVGNLSNGSLVLVAAQDEASTGLDNRSLAAIATLGATQISSLGLRDSFALVGVKGGSLPLAVGAEHLSAAGAGPARASVLWAAPLEGGIAVRVKSGGSVDGNTAEFYVDDVKVSMPTGRGMNLVLLGKDGSVLSTHTFDTGYQGLGSEPFAALLREMADGDVVLVAAKDDAYSNLTAAAKDALVGCGAIQVGNVSYRGSYALIGVRNGAALAEGASASGSGAVELSAAVPRYVPASVPLRVRSGGGADGNIAEFFVGAERISVSTGRGLNVVVMHSNGSSVRFSSVFDTHAEGSEGLVALLDGLDLGTPVMIAAKDDAKANLTEGAKLAIESLGATKIRDLKYRGSYALVGIKGGSSALAEEVVLDSGSGVAEVLAQYVKVDITTTTTTTTTTTSHIWLCWEYVCPSGFMPTQQSVNVPYNYSSGSEQSVINTCCETAEEGKMSIKVTSAGFADGNMVQFSVDGVQIQTRGGRGLTVVVLRPDGSAKSAAQVFDTYDDGSADLVSFVANLSNDTLVLVAASDEPSRNLTDAAKDSLRSLGATLADNISFRCSYALVGIKSGLASRRLSGGQAGGWALAENVSPTLGGPVTAIARYQKVAASTTLRPVCEARSPKPPVDGWFSSGQLVLEAGCRYQLWEGSNAGSCLQGAWVVIAGGSNIVLMTINLANLLAPAALEPIRDGASMGMFTVIDVLIEDGQVVYRNSSKLSTCSNQVQDAECKAAIQVHIASAPAYRPTATRITLFNSQYWDHVSDAIDTVEADAGWAPAQVSLLTQVSAWYIYCSVKQMSWCPRSAVFDQPDEAGLTLFKSEMAPVMAKLAVFCRSDGRASQYGCMVGTTSWQNPPPGRQVEWYGKYNDAIAESTAAIGSETLRLIDFWNLGLSIPEEQMGGHSSPVLNIWLWQVMLGGMCPSSQAAEGTLAKFEGSMCFAAGASESKCPEYTRDCPNTFRCEVWECANSKPCKFLAEAGQLLEEDLDGQCDDQVAYTFSAVVEAKERPCSRLWCEDSLEYLPMVLAIAAALTIFICMYIAQKVQNRRRGLEADSKDKVLPKVPGVVPEADCQEERPRIPVNLSSRSKDLRQDYESEPGSAPVSPRTPLRSAVASVVIDMTDGSLENTQAIVDDKPAMAVPVADAGAMPLADAANPPAKAAEATSKIGPKTAAAIGTARSACCGPQKAAGDKFPLGMARFCASMHVVVGHIYAKGATAPISAFGFGFTWVPWFFMLSGFVLSAAHLRRPKEETVLGYVMRRSVSIYPLYAASLFPAFAIAFSQDQVPSAAVLVAQSFLAQAWVPQWTEHSLQSHCWFLSCMVVYWFCFKPLSKAVGWLSFRGVVLWMAFLFFLPWLTVIVPELTGDGATWYQVHGWGQDDTWQDLTVITLKFNPICYAHIFILGMLLAKLRLLLDKKVAASKIERWASLVLEFVMPLGYLGLLLVFCVPDLRPWGYKLSARLSVLLPFQAMVLLGLAGLPSLPLPFLASMMAKLDFLQDYSYAVYVFQFICYSVWPVSGQVNLFFFIVFVMATAIVMVYTVQRPIQAWWGRHEKGRLAVPFVLAAILVGFSFVPQPSVAIQLADLPALRRLGPEMVDLRMPCSSVEAGGASLINPALFFQGDKVVLVARRHSLEISRRVGDFNGSAATILDETWHSQIMLGSAAVDLEAFDRWPMTGVAPFQVELKEWAGLRTPSGKLWADLCVKETWVAENNTLVRHIVTGPEDAKVVGGVNGSVTVSFNSLPPKGARGCAAGTEVSQMYIAGVTALNPNGVAVGHRLECGLTDVAEKNWIPFTHDGRLHFVYSPLPHVVVAAQPDGTCERMHSTSFQPLQKLLRENPSLEVRGSGQAMLINDTQATPQLPRAHYLALLHIFNKRTSTYSHFAYRFSPEPPFSILQVSEELPLLAAPPSDRFGSSFAFASGLALSPSGKTVVVSYGAGDRESRALVLSLRRLDEMFTCNSTAMANGLTGNMTGNMSGNNTEPAR